VMTMERSRSTSTFADNVGHLSDRATLFTTSWRSLFDCYTARPVSHTVRQMICLWDAGAVLVPALMGPANLSHVPTAVGVGRGCCHQNRSQLQSKRRVGLRRVAPSPHRLILSADPQSVRRVRSDVSHPQVLDAQLCVSRESQHGRHGCNALQKCRSCRVTYNSPRVNPTI
jgi:hypothetical protein